MQCAFIILQYFQGGFSDGGVLENLRAQIH